MSEYPSEAVVRAWARLTKAQRKALTSVEHRLSAARLPPLAWYDVLLELERAGGSLRPFELEREMLLAQYNLSRLIDRIEKAGYVERRAYADDRRGQVIAITSAGKSMRRRMWSVYGPAIQAAVGAHLSPKQIDTLAALLGALIGKSGAK
ncbi:MAG TPA: helix-turn-helix domain-containing protein [Xanthobacteraceae bacterium]|nr:helix-turn-helix domain-containing protein [Xanthobacteraceae bacterium]